MSVEIRLLAMMGLLILVVLVIAVGRKYLFRSARRVYKPKGPYLLSAGEKRFFDVLSESIPPDFYICPQVPMIELVAVDLPKDDKDFWANFNKISRKHVDFVLCRRSDFSPRLVIELDGGSHKEWARRDRDEFVDEVLKQAGIPVLHVNVVSNYKINKLTEEIQSLIL